MLPLPVSRPPVLSFFLRMWSKKQLPERQKAAEKNMGHLIGSNTLLKQEMIARSIAVVPSQAVMRSKQELQELMQRLEVQESEQAKLVQRNAFLESAIFAQEAVSAGLAHKGTDLADARAFCAGRRSMQLPEVCVTASCQAFLQGSSRVRDFPQYLVSITNTSSTKIWCRYRLKSLHMAACTLLVCAYEDCKIVHY